MEYGYTFKTYIAGGGEHYEYSTDALARRERDELEQRGQPTAIKKDFPFPKSLLMLLYLDTDKLDQLVKRIDKAIRKFLPTKDEQYMREALEGLDELARVHVYFELTRLEWRWRFAELNANGGEDRSERLPRKRITRIPAYINEIQRQIIDFHLRECVKRETRLRVCKNCGRYFAIQKRSTAEYCGRVLDAKGRTCKDVGAIALWTRNKSTDEAFKLYRREYKKRFAWIKAGKVLPEEVYAWGKRAREKKAQCEEGRITLEEFEAWLRQS